jgi:hydrogenase maturation factor
MDPRLESAAHCTSEHGCITCGDEAVAMRVVALDHDRELALCEDGRGARSSVEIALVGPLEEGDSVLVHAGTAIAEIPREQAAA